MVEPEKVKDDKFKSLKINAINQFQYKITSHSPDCFLKGRNLITFI